MKSGKEIKRKITECKEVISFHKMNNHDFKKIERQLTRIEILGWVLSNDEDVY